MKLTSFTNGIVFAGSMVPVKDYDNYIICDKNWQAQECSAKVMDYFRWSSNELPNVRSISQLTMHPKGKWGSDDEKGDHVIVSANGKSLPA